MNLEESRAWRRESSFIPAELRHVLYGTEAWVFGVKPGERGDSVPSVEETLASVVCLSWFILSVWERRPGASTYFQ